MYTRDMANQSENTASNPPGLSFSLLTNQCSLSAGPFFICCGHLWCLDYTSADFCVKKFAVETSILYSAKRVVFFCDQIFAVVTFWDNNKNSGGFEVDWPFFFFSGRGEVYTFSFSVVRYGKFLKKKPKTRSW
jgi:hypothetical protein